MQLSFKILKRPELDERSPHSLLLKECKIVKVVEDVDNTKESIEECLAAAEKKASDIVAHAVAEAEQIKKQSASEGFKQGYTEGYRQAELETKEHKENLLDLIRQANEMAPQIYKEMEGEILETAVVIAEKLVSEHLKVSPESVLAVAKEALEIVADRENVLLLVHPEQQALFECSEGELRDILDGDAKLRMVTDPEVAPGGCRIITETGEVDATMDSRWGELIKTLFPK